MARSKTHGSKELSRRARESYAAIRSVLRFEQNALAKKMDWESSSLSSAVSPNKDKPRAIEPAKMKLFESFLREDFEAKRASLDSEQIALVEKSLDSLFPNIGGTIGQRMADPGDVMPPDCENRILPDWEQSLEPYVLGNSPPARVWVLGGPKSGKSATLGRAESLAKEHGLEFFLIDVKNLAEGFAPAEKEGLEIQILEQVLQLAFGKCDRLGPPSTPPAIVVSRFIDQLRNRLLDGAAGRRIVALDHLYLFGPQHGNPNDAFRTSFDNIHAQLLNGFRNFAISPSTFFLVDDGTASANPANTQYWMKGKSIECRGELETLNMVWEANNPDISQSELANAIWAARGAGLVNPESSLHLDILGHSIFLHHAAAKLAATSDKLRELSKACNAVANAVVKETSTGDPSIDQELKSYRRRVIAWLRVKAVHCHVDFHTLCEILANSSRGVHAPQLNADEFTELSVALELGGFCGAPRIPDALLQALAREELDRENSGARP